MGESSGGRGEANDGGHETNVISVLMSVYNDAAYVRQAIESILAQSYPQFEFFITDDCSTDRSRAIIERYAQCDSRIQVIYNDRNLGLTKSLNRMIQRARGEFIARMDADDIAHPHRFEVQMDAVRRDPTIEVVFTNTRLIDKEGALICSSWRPSEQAIIDRLGQRCYIPHPTVMVRTSTLIDAGGYDEEYWTGQDHDLWQRLKTEGATFHYIPKALLDLRLNPGSVRGHSSDRYWYEVANRCIWNRNKLRALCYFDRLNWRERFRIAFKLGIPHAFMTYRGRLKNGR